MKLSSFYARCGGSYADAVARFQGEAPVLRFLRMLPDDDSLSNLLDAVSRGDAPAAFRAAHTVRGIAQNLGLPGLADSAGDLAECLRGQTVIPPEAQALCETVRQSCEAVLSLIAQLEA